MLTETLWTRMIPPAFLQNIGVWEWVLILLVVLLLFGGRKLPELARGLARGLRIFKDELEGVKKSVEQPPSEEGDTSKDQPAAKDDQPTDSQNT